MGGVPSRAAEPDPLCRPVRWLPRGAGIGVQARGSARSGLNWSTVPIPGRPSPCLVRFDKNLYSVDARTVGRPVEIRAYADRLECWQDGQVVARHDRVFGRNTTVYDPVHYVPVLARKPGALRNGAPFKEWELPPALRRVRRKLEHQPGGDRQLVEILGAVLSDGIEAVEAACSEALAHNVYSGRSEHSGAPPRTATAVDNHDAGCAEAGLRACCQLRSP